MTEFPATSADGTKKGSGNIGQPMPQNVQTNTTLWNKHKHQGLGLALDVAAGSSEEKCGLKYVMHSLAGPVWTLDQDNST